jgi:DNA-binding MarR family transcriptional regulator
MKGKFARLLGTIFRPNEPAPVAHRRAVLQELEQSVMATTRSLSRATGLSLSSVNRVVWELEQEGLVTRYRDPSDPRVMNVWLR